VGVCRVHAKRNLLAVARHQHRAVVSALISTIFAQPDAETQLRAVVDQLASTEPAVADRLQAMETDLLAYTGFPPVHWTKIWSNNPIERLTGHPWVSALGCRRRSRATQVTARTSCLGKARLSSAGPGGPGRARPATGPCVSSAEQSASGRASRTESARHCPNR